MKLGVYLIVVFGALVIGCGQSGAQSADALALKEEIKHVEDSLTTLSKNLAPGEMMSVTAQMRLIDVLNAYADNYPEDVYAPECLDKVHMVFSGMQEFDKSAAYGAKIIKNYPDYINRAMILESMASTYDIYIQPRDTEKVKYYYNLLLKENPDLPEEKVEGIKQRLKYIDLTIEEMIMKMNQ